ncbi:hypothetical protein ACJX0J_027868, partial [Zea mays]
MHANGRKNYKRTWDLESIDGAFFLQLHENGVFLTIPKGKARLQTEFKTLVPTDMPIYFLMHWLRLLERLQATAEASNLNQGSVHALKNPLSMLNPIRRVSLAQVYTWMGIGSLLILLHIHT